MLSSWFWLSLGNSSVEEFIWKSWESTIEKSFVSPITSRSKLQESRAQSPKARRKKQRIEFERQVSGRKGPQILLYIQAWQIDKNKEGFGKVRGSRKRRKQRREKEDAGGTKEEKEEEEGWWWCFGFLFELLCPIPFFVFFIFICQRALTWRWKNLVG